MCPPSVGPEGGWLYRIAQTRETDGRTRGPPSSSSGVCQCVSPGCDGVVVVVGAWGKVIRGRVPERDVWLQRRHSRTCEYVIRYALAKHTHTRTLLQPAPHQLSATAEESQVTASSNFQSATAFLFLLACQPMQGEVAGGEGEQNFFSFFAQGLTQRAERCEATTTGPYVVCSSSSSSSSSVAGPPRE